jgi:hypothetical protein
MYDFIVIAYSPLDFAGISTAAIGERGRIHLSRELTTIQFRPAEYSFGHARAVGPNHQIIFNYYEFIYPACIIKWVFPDATEIYGRRLLSMSKGLQSKYERKSQQSHPAYVFYHLYLPVVLPDVILGAKPQALFGSQGNRLNGLRHFDFAT